MSPDRTYGGNENDEVLLVAAKADSQQFALLYDRYVDPIFRYCDRRLDDRAAAEDATSQIFEKAFASLATCRSDLFRPWLYRIAHNVVIDTYRRQHPAQHLDEAQLVADQADGPEELVITAEVVSSVRGLLDSLTPDQRDVIELRLAGLNGIESMAVLGISRDVLGARTYRAMNRLRELVNTANSPGVQP